MSAATFQSESSTDNAALGLFGQPKLIPGIAVHSAARVFDAGLSAVGRVGVPAYF